MEKVLIDPTKALFYRKEAKLSQDELSSRLGASRRLVAGMEDKTSHVELSPYETHLYASALNISAPQLWAEVPKFFRYYGRAINSGEELARFIVNLESKSSFEVLSLPAEKGQAEALIQLVEIVDKEKEMNWFDRAERRNGPQADFIRLKIIIRDLYATLTIWEEDDRTPLNQNYENFIFRVIETFHLEDGLPLNDGLSAENYYWRKVVHLTFDRDDNKNGGETFSIPCWTIDNIKENRDKLFKSYSETGRLPEEFEHQLIGSILTDNIRTKAEDVAFASDATSMPNEEMQSKSVANNNSGRANAALK